MIDVHEIYKQRDLASQDFSEKEKQQNITNYTTNEALG
ncbi:hypothetical protein PMIT1313_00227 [Prochlorococcus marinus str. MIT 1313]|nr:hypothetical protein PMIT1313_00227 [Prochlorococcus marinus str. MIT 1313]